MKDSEIVKAFDVLEKMEFFGGQRAGRELWFNKPIDIQNKDIGKFLRDIDFLKTFINSQQAEIERLQKDNSELMRLPCKVGDTIYFDTYRRGESIGVQPHKVAKVEVIVSTERQFGSVGAEIPDWQFGKNVFLSREEAEKALAERRKH